MTNITSLMFGDVFIFNDNDYIFLAQTEEITYAARILSIEETKKIDSLANLKASQYSKKDTINTNILYCYVILKTREFQDRMAHFNNSQKSFPTFIKSTSILSMNDKKQIKQEIITKKAIIIELKELVQKIPL